MRASRTVIKLGGELLEPERDPELQAITADIRRLIAGRHEIVLVHGGGPQTSALQRALGQEPRIVAGRRVTDLSALDAIKMVVGGKLNIELCSALRSAGVAAFGLNGVSGGAITCVRRPARVIAGGGDQPIDFGLVGDVTGVNAVLFELLLGRGYTPVLACIGSDASGQPYNINADVVASSVAVALSADRLLLLTGTSGVLTNVADRASRIPRLTAEEAVRAIATGVVRGGMIPKLEESIEALSRGVREVLIAGDLREGDLARAFEEPGAIGTAVVSSG